MKFNCYSRNYFLSLCSSVVCTEIVHVITADCRFCWCLNIKHFECWDELMHLFLYCRSNL